MNDDLLTNWRLLMERATAFLGQEDYRNAEKYYLQSLKLAKQMAVPVILAFNLRLLSTTRIKQGKIEAAERGFREALLICQKIQNQKGMSEAMAGLASVAAHLQHWGEAVSWYEEAIQVYPATAPRLRLGMIFSDLGQVYTAMEDWTKAKEAYNRARELCHLYGFRKGEGELSLLLAEVAYRQKKVSEARTDLIDASKIFVETSDWVSLVNAIQYFAFIDFEQGILYRARESWQRVIILYLRLGQVEDVAESTYFLAKILQDLKEYSEAVYYLELSIQTYARQDLGLAYRLENMGQLEMLRSNDETALDFLKKAVSLFEANGEELKLGETYELMAEVAERLGEHEEALRYQAKARKSLELHQVYSLSATQRIAEYFENRLSYLDALHYYWQSLRIARELGIETLDLERSIQRISKKVRRKGK